MAEIWGAVVGAVVSAGVGAGLSAALSPGAPKSPDASAATRAGVEAEAQTLDDRRRLEAAAQQGSTAKYFVPQRTQEVSTKYAMLPPSMWKQAGSSSVKYVEADWKPGGKYYVEGQAAPKTFTRTEKVTTPSHMATADFTGWGEADVQGKVAQQMAQLQLELSKKYGTQFAEEARKQLELADPEGSAARKKAYDLIQQQIERQPERPVADLLDKQVQEQLAAGKGLDRVSQEVLDDAVAKAAAARGGADHADYSEPLTTGFEGQQRLDDAQQKALSWLTSGATPEDVAYRREQQNLSNLSAFAAGRTPESQFQTLSGAQSGAAPMYTGNKLPSQNPNAGPAMNNAQLQGWQTQMGAAAQQADPWMAGISALLSGASAAGAAGWKPLATSV